MDPGDDFEVLRPFSNFSGEIWNWTLFPDFLGSGFPGMPRSKNSKFNCWPLHLSPRVVQRFSGPGEFRMPGPAGLKKTFFRILDFQNKLGPIRGKFEKPFFRRKKGYFSGEFWNWTSFRFDFSIFWGQGSFRSPSVRRSKKFTLQMLATAVLPPRRSAFFGPRRISNARPCWPQKGLFQDLKFPE